MLLDNSINSLPNELIFSNKLIYISYLLLNKIVKNKAKKVVFQLYAGNLKETN